MYLNVVKQYYKLYVLCNVMLCTAGSLMRAENAMNERKQGKMVARWRASTPITTAEK